MKTLLLSMAWTLAATSLPAAGFADTAKPAEAATAASATPDKTGPQRVQVVTSQGNFTIELNAERAPLTVASFLKYVDQGQYTRTLIHRAIPNFVIQGGGYDTDYRLKPAATKTFNESGNGLTNLRGTVGLARTAEPHSGDCQFYVNIGDNNALDPSQSRWGYAVFGKIVDGMDVVDHIATRATGPKGPFKEDSPLEPVIIEKIERVAGP
jgi:cyclophilin family peptidyl-prolyl cis-trans isomerase